MTAIRDYDGLISVVKARIDEIGISHDSLEALCGFGRGHLGKMLGPSRVKNIGLHSLFILADGLAMEFSLTPNLELAQKMAHRWEKRDELRRVPGIIRRKFSPELRGKALHEELTRLGSIGGHTRAKNLAAKHRVRIARKASKARWRKANEIGAKCG